MGRGADERHFCPAIGQYGRPFQPITGRQHPHVGSIDADYGHMSSFQIELVGAGVCAENQPFFIGTQRNMFAHEVAGGQQKRRSPAGRQRVQMRPTIGIRHKNDPVGRRPVQVGAALRVRYGTPQRRRGRPDTRGGTRSYLSRVEAPRSVLVGEQRVRRTTCAGHPHKHDFLPVRRPAGRGIAAKRGGNPLDGSGSVGVNADEGMIAPIGDEKQGSTIGTPRQRGDGSPDFEQIFSRIEQSHWRGPYLSVLDEGHPLAIGRNDRIIPAGKVLFGPSGVRNADYLHLRSEWIRRRIHGLPIVPVAPVIATSHKYNPFTIL